MLASDGVFSVKSAWKVISTITCMNSKKKWVWSVLLPTKMSLFLRWIPWNVVAVDVNVQSRSIRLVSKCNCCVHSQVETLDHLLLQGELGTNVWLFFANALHMQVYKDVASTISTWHDCAKESSYKHALIGLLLGFIC